MSDNTRQFIAHSVTFVVMLILVAALAHCLANYAL